MSHHPSCELPARVLKDNQTDKRKTTTLPKTKHQHSHPPSLTDKSAHLLSFFNPTPMCTNPSSQFYAYHSIGYNQHSLTHIRGYPQRTASDAGTAVLYFCLIHILYQLSRKTNSRKPSGLNGRAAGTTGISVSGESVLTRVGGVAFRVWLVRSGAGKAVMRAADFR